MAVLVARVRRDSDERTIDATRLVPGDVVLVEAGDRIPGDGRLVVANSLEIDESILTGESEPTAKATVPLPLGREHAGVGDRTSMVHMNTSVTRGRGEFLVTATGMRTEVGRIATLLATTTSERTPLQRQLDQLGHGLAKLAAVIVATVFVVGLVRGSSVSEMLLTGVALAVAAIPEGLPAVTAVTLAIGVAKMAERNAIVKRLASVETLGSTNVICSDKTGTLTMNEMTAVELVAGMRRYRITGSGYEPDGAVEPVDGLPIGAGTLTETLAALTLCNDAALRHGGDRWYHTGDPTETALLVAAVKGGVDISGLRACRPRGGEAPFESATKLMATAHASTDPSSRAVIYVKGAPDVLLTRATTVLTGEGAVVPITLERERLDALVEEMGWQGLRVLAVAERTLDHHEAAALDTGALSVAQAARGLTMLGLVGLLDPPRPDVPQAIRDAHAAGVTVKMITGDHATTAGSIAHSLGIVGDVVTGAELDRIDDDELDRRLARTGVFARVSPEHKLRLVTALQRTGNVVAMTGDGVNDAPALKRADIGVAMGITGTDVTKQAATMVLADDKFTTIALRVLALADLLDVILHRFAGDVLAAGAGDRRVEEVLELEDALRRVHVLGGGDAADGRLVHADVLGDVAQDERLQVRDALVEEVALELHDALRHFMNRALPLLNRAEQPLRRAHLLLHEFLLLRVERAVAQGPAVRVADAQLGQPVVVEDHVVVLAHLRGGARH